MRLWQRDIVKLRSGSWSWFKMSLKLFLISTGVSSWVWGFSPSLPPSLHLIITWPLALCFTGAEWGGGRWRLMLSFSEEQWYLWGGREDRADSVCQAWPGPRWKIDKWKFMTPGKWSCHVKLTNVSLIIDKRRIENLTNETLKIDECQEWIMTSVTDLCMTFSSVSNGGKFPFQIKCL